MYLVVSFALNFLLKSLGVEGSSNSGLGAGGGGFVRGMLFTEKKKKALKELCQAVPLFIEQR